MTNENSEPERLLSGRYRLTELIGEGGMGRVWEGVDELLDRPVAVKELIIPPQLPDSEVEVLRTRMLREARNAAQLSHPSIITVFDVVETDERPWIVMELVRGPSMGDLIKRDGVMPPERVARIGVQVAAALSVAHERGIVHRDIKPGNVLIARDDRAVLTDFGIAHLEGSTHLTSTGLLVGSPSYLAPEQAHGKPATPATDMWSLGVTLYQAVEGVTPFNRTTPMATLTAIVTAEVPPPASAGVLTPVLERLLEKDAERRPAVHETARMLQEAAENGKSGGNGSGGRDTHATTLREQPPVPGGGAGAAGGAAAAGAAGAANGAGGAAAGGAGAASEGTGAGGGSGADAGHGAGGGSGRGAGSGGGSGTGGSAWRSGDNAPESAMAAGPAGAGGAAAGSGGSGTPPFHDASIPPGPGGGGRSGGAAGGSGGRRRNAALAVLGGLVALAAVAGLVLWLGMRSGADPEQGSTAGGEASLSPSASAADPQETAAQQDGGGGSPDPAETNGSGDGGGNGDNGNDEPELPDMEEYEDETGFAVDIPENWSYDRREGTSVFFDIPSGGYLQIDQTDNPANNARKDWEEQEPAISQNFPGYELVGIEALGEPYTDDYISAADWEFTFDGSGGTRMHAVNRAFHTEEKGYALFLVSPEEDFATNQAILDEMTESFEPAE